MRRVPRLALVAWVFVSAGGCAAITGLDSLQEQDCAPLCGDSQAGDVTVEHGGDDVQSQDRSTGDDVASETGSEGSSSGGPEGSTTDAPHESSAGEAGKEGGTDAPPESAPDAPPDVSPDAPFDSGCGDLNTVNNCSACGDKCAPTSASVTSVSCPGATNGAGATCSYTCATGYLDCNGATNPPNLDGCECHAPGATLSQCCATSGGDCPIQHNNGLGQASSLFWDCVPTGTMSAKLAQDACIAYVGAANAAQCQIYSDADSGVPDSYCSGSFTGDCICWTYVGQYVGTVFDAKAQGAPNPTLCYYGPTSTTFN